jgi:hypothetical protein
MASHETVVSPAANGTPQPALARVAWLSVWIGLLLLGIYLLTTGGQTFISDGELMLITTTRIVDLHTLTLPEEASAFPQAVRGQGGFLFSRYGVGQPLAAGVLYAFGTYVVGMWLLPDSAPYLVGRFFALLLPAIATALAGGVLAAWAARLYRSLAIGAALGLLFGLGTLAWPYSRFFFSEPLFMCCLLLAAVGLAAGWPLAGGLALGYALATRIGGVFVVPVFLVYAWLYRHRVRDMLWLLVGMLPGGVLIVLNNWVRFRALTEQGYGGEGFTGNLFEGLAGLLFSPGKSLFLYVPLFVALPFAALPFVRRFRAEAVLVGLLTLTLLVQSALWWIWWGGWGWGPRFLVPLMPFLVLPLGVLLERRSWRWIIGAGLLPLSVAVNMLGILVDFNIYLSEFTRGVVAREQLYLWQPMHSPLLAHLQRLDLSEAPIVSFQLSRSDIGFPEPAATLLSIGMILLVLGAFAGLWRTMRQPARHARA